MKGTPLRSVEKVKYLGVYLNNKLTRHDHIDHICTKANRLLGFLKLNLYSCHKHFKEYAYNINNFWGHHLSTVVPAGIHIIRQTSQSLKWYSTKQHNFS